MHDQPRPNEKDPEATQAHDLTAAGSSSTWSDAAPEADEAAPAQGPEAPEVTDRYTPAPEPRADWADHWAAPVPPTPERWYEPAPAMQPVAPSVGRRRGAGTASLVGVALLSAVLASGGTVLTLGAVGVLDRPAPGQISAQGTEVGAPQQLTIDESSATINVAAKVSPAVVRITVQGSSDAGNLGVIPETGVGSGVIYDSNGWILTNRHVVEGGSEFEVELKDGQVLSGEVYGIDTLTDLAIVKSGSS